MKHLLMIVCTAMVMLMAPSCKKKTYSCYCYENGVVVNSNATVTAYSKGVARNGCSSIAASYGYDECKLQ
ncbi:MAG: hypothetical protein JST82_01335 [Bacteroidetes bacterium]|nr:hypothetical protein [Bacteroidota bacterium]